ncbi:TIGR01777 family oxidoreductase [Corynebacterium pilosum]|uniref:Nucleoside-diphosphate sugar epimerase n=1 Tax=Corynebacterium pilosum TaxID=35756 RepID=A0A376CQF6_9CORY|nr:TIGR01777 family oxidoreductase [Corynebacterium pilosum]STC70533.1 nucleoside-diphosphate sugar epimerase [Corynebacterium pilosum]
MGITAHHVVPADRDTVWEWHTRPGAVARLAPTFLPMKPVQAAERLADGTTIFSLPAGLKWVARHDLSGYRTGHVFTDVCINAPIKVLAGWRHVHRFESLDDDPLATLVTDEISTRVPAGTLEPMVAYRQHQLIEDISFLNRVNAAGATTPLTIAMTGSRGHVGRALMAQLQTAGHTVIQLVRGEAKEHQRHWNPQRPARHLLRGVDAVVHLAGEPLMGRFNEAHKKEIYASRVAPTEKLARLAADTEGVHAFVSASAVGYYGAAGSESAIDETAPRGEGFLADTVEAWENATEPARAAGLRVVNVRSGIALGSSSGVLPIFRAVSATGLATRFGDGEFWMSWIALDDLTDIYFRALVDDTLSGPINATAPHPVKNSELSDAIAKALKNPQLMPVPTFGPRILLGKEGAEELVMADQNIRPGALEDAGHTFRYPTLDVALAHELGTEKLYGA